MSQTMASPAPAWAGGLAPALDRFPHRRVCPESGAYGIGLYSKPAFRRATLERFPWDGPVSVVARFDLGGDPFTLVLTHVHTPFAGDIHRRQFEALAEATDRFDEHLAICGDLNSVPWSSSFRHLASAGDLADSHSGHWLEGSWPSWGMAHTGADRQLPDQSRRHRCRASVRTGRWLRSLPVAYPPRHRRGARSGLGLAGVTTRGRTVLEMLRGRQPRIKTAQPLRLRLWESAGSHPGGRRFESD
jgi:hypothetical protein